VPFTLTTKPSGMLRAASVLVAVSLALCGPHSSAGADDAYIRQAATETAERMASQPLHVAPASPYTQGSVAYVPTPEMATAGKSLNLAQTLEAGRNNAVAQFQAGQNNFSNVGVLGGSRNAVGVLQAGNDVSNLYLVNTQGLSVGVLQPKGAAPSNVLIARLPNGALVIKK